MDFMQKVSYCEEGNIVSVRPYVTQEVVIHLAKDLYGLDIDVNEEIKELVSYADRNFLVKGKLLQSDSTNQKSYSTTGYQKYVLKIYNSNNNFENVNLICKVCDYCASHPAADFQVPKPIALSSSNNFLSEVLIPLHDNAQFEGGYKNCLNASNVFTEEADGAKKFQVRHLVTLSKFIPGKTFAKDDITEGTLLEMGRKVANLHKILEEYPSIPDENHRELFIWNTACDSSLIKEPYVICNADNKKKETLLFMLDLFDKDVKPKLECLSKQWIHNDLNNENLILESGSLVGYIDFGDISYSYRIVDVSVCLFYICNLVEVNKYKDMIRYFLLGYLSNCKLNDTEIDLIYPLILKRLTHTVAISEYTYRYVDPGNEYLLITSKDTAPLMNYFLSKSGESEIKKAIKDAATESMHQ